MRMLRWCVVLLLCHFPVLAFSQKVSGDEVELHGTIREIPQKAVCTVELNPVQNLASIQRAICAVDGSFEFTRVQRGTYNLVVHVGTNQYSEEVQLLSTREDVEIQLPVRRESAESVVSMAELKVPEKANEELQKAHEAMAKGELEKADQYTARALNIAPEFPRAMTLRAVLMIAKQDFNSALQIANHAAGLDPNLAMTQFVRASAFNATGRPRDAQQAAEQGLRLEPGSWQGHLELARALMAQNQFAPALAEIDRAAAKAPPQMSDLLLMRASVLLALHDANGARQNLDQFSRLRPGDTRATKLQSMLEASSQNQR
jgi:tetratricopeptide (TPR) repeat protein